MNYSPMLERIKLLWQAWRRNRYRKKNHGRFLTYQHTRYYLNENGLYKARFGVPESERSDIEEGEDSTDKDFRWPDDDPKAARDAVIAFPDHDYTTLLDVRIIKSKENTRAFRRGMNPTTPPQSTVDSPTGYSTPESKLLQQSAA